jgi:hypothetical protein
MAELGTVASIIAVLQLIPPVASGLKTLWSLRSAPNELMSTQDEASYDLDLQYHFC